MGLGYQNGLSNRTVNFEKKGTRGEFLRVVGRFFRALNQTESTKKQPAMASCFLIVLRGKFARFTGVFDRFMVWPRSHFLFYGLCLHRHALAPFVPGDRCGR